MCDKVGIHRGRFCHTFAYLKVDNIHIAKKILAGCMCFIAFPPSPPILSLFCPQPDLLLFFSSFHPLSPLYCMILLTLHFHPGSVILLSSSLLFPTHLLHHPCISFTAEAAPVKLILLLCCGASSTHRLGFPLTQSLWACVFLSFTLLL